MNQSAPTTPKPPKSRGRIMDFTPRKPLVTPSPRAVEQPVIRMPAQEPQPAVVQVTRTVVAVPKPQPRPASPVRHVAPAPVVPKRPLSQPAPTPVAAPAPEPKTPVHPEPAKKPAKKPTPLGARSPFFKKSVSVEKRPLSGGAASMTHAHASHRQSARDLPRPQIQQHSSAIKLANRKSKLPMVLLIMGTVLVGAAVGACAYFLIFQGE